MTALSTPLSAEYGRGFSRPNLFRMIQFAEMSPDEKIVSALRRQTAPVRLVAGNVALPDLAVYRRIETAL